MSLLQNYSSTILHASWYTSFILCKSRVTILGHVVTCLWAKLHTRNHIPIVKNYISSRSWTTTTNCFLCPKIHHMSFLQNYSYGIPVCITIHLKSSLVTLSLSKTWGSPFYYPICQIMVERYKIINQPCISPLQEQEFSLKSYPISAIPQSWPVLNHF